MRSHTRRAPEERRDREHVTVCVTFDGCKIVASLSRADALKAGYLELDPSTPGDYLPRVSLPRQVRR